MGKTFSQPTYFYQDNTAPDLVDTNGPLYSRTGVNLGNIVPTKFIIDNQTYTSGQAEYSKNFDIDIVSHDLSVVRLVAAPMENDSDEPLFMYRVVGRIVTTLPNDSITIGYTYSLGVSLQFEPFSAVNGFVMSCITNRSVNTSAKTTITGFSGQITGVITDSHIDALAGALVLCGCRDDEAPSLPTMSSTFTLY